MYVVKRDGRQEPVHFDKITARITKLSYGLNPEFCDPVGSSAFELTAITSLSIQTCLPRPSNTRARTGAASSTC